MRQRKIKKIGNSWFVQLNPVDLTDYEMKEGDIVDIEDCLVIHYNAKKKRRSKKST